MRGDACVSVNRKVEIYGKMRTKLNVADSEDGMGKGRGAEDTFFPLYIFVFLHYVHAYGKNSRLKISTMQTLKKKKDMDILPCRFGWACQSGSSEVTVTSSTGRRG